MIHEGSLVNINGFVGVVQVREVTEGDPVVGVTSLLDGTWLPLGGLSRTFLEVLCTPMLYRAEGFDDNPEPDVQHRSRRHTALDGYGATSGESGVLDGRNGLCRRSGKLSHEPGPHPLSLSTNGFLYICLRPAGIRSADDPLAGLPEWLPLQGKVPARPDTHWAPAPSVIASLASDVNRTSYLPSTEPL